MTPNDTNTTASSASNGTTTSSTTTGHALPTSTPVADATCSEAVLAQGVENMRAFTQRLAGNAACRPSIPPPAEPPRPLFDFKRPRHFINYALPPDAILVGDCHLTRGDLAVIAGVPGCGKSRLLISLAIAGKQGKGATWMGLPVHAEFKTAILQAENGEVRLQQELSDIEAQGHDLDEHLMITPPPPEGFAFTNAEFCRQLHAWLDKERPGVIALDPWNCAVSDDKARDFRDALNAVRACLPEGPTRPALVILHHLRKTASGDSRKTGRDLLNELSGSYVIGAACRTAFILEPASPDPEDTRVVFTCAKNNNGPMGPSTAWHRQNGLFAPCEEFDFKEWREGAGGKRRSVDLQNLAEIFEGGEKMLSRMEAARLLGTVFGFGKTAAYDALSSTGRFAEHLSEAGGFINFKP